MYLAALFIFLAASAVTWFVSVACYDSLVGEPRLRRKPEFTAASAVTVGFTTLACFIPFPGGYLLSLVAYGLAAWSWLGLSIARGMLLFALLASVSFVVRLAIAGAVSY